MLSNYEIGFISITYYLEKSLGGPKANLICSLGIKVKNHLMTKMTIRSKAEEKAAELYNQIQENLKKNQKNFFLTALDPNSTEFLDIQAKVNGSNLLIDNPNLKKSVIKIKKITNIILEEAFERAKSQSFGTTG